MLITLPNRCLTTTYFALLVYAVFGFACSSNERLIERDEEAKQTIAKVARMLKSKQKPSTKDFNNLKAVFEKYPEEEISRRIYLATLIEREDWEAVEEVLAVKDLSKLNDEEKQVLAETYVKLSKFTQALELLKPLVKNNPNNSKLIGVVGLTYFNLGENGEAAKHFDSIWDELLTKKDVEKISMRGIIYFRQNNLPKALETLEKALEIDPNHISSLNTLSRIYAKKDDQEKAEKYKKRTALAQQKLQKDTFAKSKRVKQIIELEEAWEKKNYRVVISLSKELIQTATDPNQKSALYAYLSKSYTALGMNEEASRAMKMARQLNKK